MATQMRGILVLIVGLMLAAGPALAAGGGGSSSSSGGTKQNSDYAKAEGLIKTGKYADAIPLLEQVTAKDPKNADAHNYLGYSHRQIGQVDLALQSYRTALKIDPSHRGANEYLGELYLQLGQLDKAEERLQVLDDACFLGCEEFSELKKAIKDYKAKQGAS